MLGKEIIGGLATLLGTGSCLIYLWQIFKRTTKPHVFSWFIWGILSLIGFLAQYAAKAGPGSWAVGASSLFCFVVAFTGLFYGEKAITRGDWVCFIFSLSSIPVWLATSNPLWAVVIVSAIDAVAFYPTVRKSWFSPQEEGMTTFFIYGLQMFLALAALESYTLTTVLYPATIFVLNMGLTFMLFYRRRILA